MVITYTERPRVARILELRSTLCFVRACWQYLSLMTTKETRRPEHRHRFGSARLPWWTVEMEWVDWRRHEPREIPSRPEVPPYLFEDVATVSFAV